MATIPDLNVEEFISHYGVPGMKWGKRKASSETPRASGYSDRMVSNDTKRLGKKSVKNINDAVAGGKSLKTARNEEYDRRATQRSKRNAAIVGAGVLGVMYGPLIAEVAVRSLNSAVLAKRTSNGKKYAEQMMRDRTTALTNYDTVHMRFDPTTDIWS